MTLIETPECPRNTNMSIGLNQCHGKGGHDHKLTLYMHVLVDMVSKCSKLPPVLNTNLARRPMTSDPNKNAKARCTLKNRKERIIKIPKKEGDKERGREVTPEFILPVFQASASYPSS